MCYYVSSVVSDIALGMQGMCFADGQKSIVVRVNIVNTYTTHKLNILKLPDLPFGFLLFKRMFRRYRYIGIGIGFGLTGLAGLDCLADRW